MPVVRQPVSPLPESLEFLDPGIDPSGMVMPLVTRTPQLLERLATRGLGRIDVGLVRELAKTKPGSPEARTIIDLMALTRGGGEPAAQSYQALTRDIPLTPEGIAGIPSRVMDVLRGARERYLGKALERGTMRGVAVPSITPPRLVLGEAIDRVAHGAWGNRRMRNLARQLNVTDLADLYYTSPTSHQAEDIVQALTQLRRETNVYSNTSSNPELRDLAERLADSIDSFLRGLRPSARPLGQSRPYTLPGP